MTDFRTRLTAGFKALRREGYFARQGWKCCQGCGRAALPSGVYLAWAGNGKLIAETFRKAGCAVVWNGNDSTRIWVCDGPVKDPVAEADAAYRAQLEAL